MPVGRPEGSLNFNYEMAVEVCLHAMTYGYKPACEKYDVSRKTIFNYRTRLSGDEYFTQLYTERVALVNEELNQRTNQLCDKYLTMLEKVCDNPDTQKDADLLKEATNAFKAVNEVRTNNQLLNVHLQQYKQITETSGQVITASSSTRALPPNS